jgi:anhydro-N-acetylmuramic acid kinase
MRVIGLISGTSMDGLDVAVADFTGAETGELRMRPIGARTWDWPAELRRRLLALLPPASTTIGEVAELDTLVGEESARAAVAALDEIAGGTADLVVSHGQTVFHWVEGGTARGTLQIGQPAPIAEATGLPVITDVRARDIAAGGQGAPLASTLDALVLRAHPGVNAALNLGGIANVTVVPPTGEVIAFDTGPASCLIDATVSRLTDGAEAYDHDGLRARRGSVDARLLDRLLADPFYALPPPRSTGRELFTDAYVQAAIGGLNHPVAPDDLVATLTELTARTIAKALAPYGVRAVYASGGGVHNPALMDALRAHLGTTEVHPSDALGLPVDDKEAYLMALVGYLTWHGLPGVLPGATGSTRPHVLGRISPATGSAQPPRSLTVVV